MKGAGRSTRPGRRKDRREEAKRPTEDRSESRTVERPGAFWVVSVLFPTPSRERPGAFWVVPVSIPPQERERPGAFEVVSELF
jgi:hypothetical protein